MRGLQKVFENMSNRRFINIRPNIYLQFKITGDRTNYAKQFEKPLFSTVIAFNFVYIIIFFSNMYVTYTHASTLAHKDTHIHSCAHIHAHTHTHTHTHTHIHTYKHTRKYTNI